MTRPISSSRLRTYSAKRNFAATPEPLPEKAPKKRSDKLAFCVQRHLARALHYDFRLECDGVLLSWTVPKGPSLNPKDRRMAVQTEDHPLAYGDFEGVIPDGYGAGVVMLWDRGVWEPEVPDIAAALERGDLKFRLDGVKLKGSWVLVRTRKRSGDAGPQQWLLIKHRDEWSGEVDVTTAAPDSVKSFGDLASIVRASPDAAGLARHAAAGAGTGDAARLLRQVLQDASTAPIAPTPTLPGGVPPRVKPQKVSAKAAVRAITPRVRKQPAKAPTPSPSIAPPPLPTAALSFPTSAKCFGRKLVSPSGI